MSEAEPRPNLPIRAAILIGGDLLFLEVAFLVTYWFRFQAGWWPTPLGVPPFDVYLLMSFFMLVIFFGIFYASGMYTVRGGRRVEDDLVCLFKGVVLGNLLLLALAFFFGRLTYSRSFFGLFFLSCFFFLTFGKIGARLLLRRVFQRGMGVRRLLLIGESPMRERVLRATRELPGSTLRPVGWLSVNQQPEPELFPAGPEGLPRLGHVANVHQIVLDQRIDLVVLTLPFDQLPQVSAIAAQLASLNTDLQFVPDLPALQTSKMRLTEIAGIPFISVREDALSGADRIVKRCFDLICAALGLLVLLPVLCLLALLVKLGSAGPVFYSQERVGRDGHEFRMLKFRTMRVAAEAKTGPVWTVEEDPRVTPAGRILRRFSLDELPQLWNVLIGDMSLVGPRPERRVFVDQFQQKLPRYFERHRVRSGLTGWAQVHGLRGNTSISERTLYDLYYVENWSLGLDVKIILMTIHHVLRGENAY